MEGPWAILAAVVAVLALVWGVYASARPAGQPAPNQANGNTQNQEQGCQAQGQNNTIDCEIITPGAPPIGKMEFVGTSVVWAFKGGPEDVPDAPDYPAEAYRDHCSYWTRWFAEHPKMFQSTPLVSLQVTAGTSDLITIRRISTVIYEKEPLDDSNEFTRITCIHGGGLNPGYVAVPSIDSGVTEVSEGLSDEVAQMPPATISVRDNGEEVLIAPKGQGNTLYTGSIVVQYSVNGEDKTLQYGDRDRPYRWIDGQLSTTTPSIDWDERDRRWKPAAEVLANR